MYADNSLTPREAIRLCALGILAQETSSREKSLHYDDLVFSVRHFVSRITGPSLDLMGESIELLRYEGLVESEDAQNVNPSPKSPKPAELRCKLFEGELTGRQQRSERAYHCFEVSVSSCSHPKTNGPRPATHRYGDTELARLDDLLFHHDPEGGHFTEWLKHDIQRLEERLNWLTVFRDKL